MVQPHKVTRGGVSSVRGVSEGPTHVPPTHPLPPPPRMLPGALSSTPVTEELHLISQEKSAKSGIQNHLQVEWEKERGKPISSFQTTLPAALISAEKLGEAHSCHFKWVLACIILSIRHCYPLCRIFRFHFKSIRDSKP